MNGGVGPQIQEGRYVQADGQVAHSAPELVGVYKVRETPAVQNMASSWDQGPQEGIPQ